MAERILLGGTDGFRGEATMEPGDGIVNPDTFAGATYALLEYQLDLGISGPVVTARDTRPSSEALLEAVNAAAVVRGVEVWSLDVAPTPTAQRVAQEAGAMATIVVTASHNPYSDNGWKGMLGNRKPGKAEVADISDRYWRNVDYGLTIPLDASDGAYRRPELLGWYAGEVVRGIEQEFGARPLAGKLFVVDGANGAAQNLTPQIFKQLGAEVATFSCDGSGYINDGCGAAELSGLKQFLAARPDLTSYPNFVGAIANDGDADRMMGVGVRRTDSGVEFVEINGNHVMEALAQGQPGIVGTEYTNTALVRRIRGQGVEFEYCANGDVYVTEALLKKQAAGEPWTRGGEFTGHHVVTDWLSSGDGVRMAAWFASYVATRGQTFADVYENLPLWAEMMAKVKFPGAGKDTIKDHPEVRDALIRVEAELGADGRIVLRPSGTEPVVRVWGEGLVAPQIKLAVAGLADIVRLRAAA